MIKQGSIYWVNLDPTEGHEQGGKRPVLVISKTALNKHLNGLAVAVPITNGGRFISRSGLGVPLPKGMKTTGQVIICSPRQMDFMARQAQYIETLPPALLADILARHAALY